MVGNTLPGIVNAVLDLSWDPKKERWSSVRIETATRPSGRHCAGRGSYRCRLTGVSEKYYGDAVPNTLSLSPSRPESAARMAHNLLPGKTVIVTGCSTGIGRAIAIRESSAPCPMFKPGPPTSCREERCQPRPPPPRALHPIRHRSGRLRSLTSRRGVHHRCRRHRRPVHRQLCRSLPLVHR